MISIIGLMLVKNEDRFVGQALQNIVDFCDHIYVEDNWSGDHTYEIVEEVANRHDHITVQRVDDPAETHRMVKQYMGTPTWIFGVDGDEVYDAKGLQVLRARLKEGDFREHWCVFGNVMHCAGLDDERGKAVGYLSPPARSNTKLYNFSMITSWENVPERLIGEPRFKKGFDASLRLGLGHDLDWESSYYRCLHLPFLVRSSLDQGLTNRFTSRLNPTELFLLRGAFSSGWREGAANLAEFYRKHGIRALVITFARLILRRGWKYQKYNTGPLVEKDIAPFFVDPIAAVDQRSNA